MRGVVNTVGRLVQRGVLPNLRRLSLGGASLEVREESEAPEDSGDADGAGGGEAANVMRATVRSPSCLTVSTPLALASIK